MPKPLKIVLTGPESTGKTTLTRELAAHFGVPYAREYAREYIDALDRKYKESDLMIIAKEQLRLEQEARDQADKFYFCDTDLLTIQIWLEDKFGTKDDWLTKMIQRHQADLYLLCDTDLPWQPDPQREDGHRRDELLSVYKNELENMKADWVKITGLGKDRLRNTTGALKKAIFE